MKRIIRIDEKGFARCGKCGHKLFETSIDSNSDVQVRFLNNALAEIGFEIKCHSCKSINVPKGESL